MRLFGRRGRPYDRTRLLAQAVRARKKGRRKKAIALYRQVLAVEPQNEDLHRRIAPLLVKTKQPDAAWESYRCAVEGLANKGFLDHAVGVLREASALLPKRVALWHVLSDLELERRGAADAAEVLLEARRHFRSRRERERAISLLLRARRLVPLSFGVNLELAKIFARAGAPRRARGILKELASRSRGRELRRVRGQELRLSPTPFAAWRWLRAAVAGT
jgi:thioredoxin-like negative regulator of GroEL